MWHSALLILVLLVSFSSSTTVLKKTLSRRQVDTQPCQVLEGFDCKCVYNRVTCSVDNSLPSPIRIVPNEEHKYQSVELVIAAARDISVNDRTFEPVKGLYKPDADSVDFRVKFEKFTRLDLTSPGFLNRVFPDNLPANARKSVALEISNYDVQPNDNVNLFQNLNVNNLELYALYPFRGTFQQLFDGANINYVRLSGGDIRSDTSQPFTGNIARLELAKQATELSVRNFPVYPAHELVINAHYITDFNDQNPPNYENLAELHVQSPERIPANAFRNFPNLRVLTVSSVNGVDPQAFSGLNNLEKLTVKDTEPSVELLNSLPNLKELETSVEKLNEKTQCQLLDKLANGQLAVQAISNGRECTCVSAYLDAAAGRGACDAQHCEHSSCAAIKNNYDASTRTFKAPPAILRADGSNALYPRTPRVYQAAAKLSQQDQEKLQQAFPQQVQQPQEEYPTRTGDEQQGPYQPDQNQGDNQGNEGQDTNDNQGTGGDENQPGEGGNEGSETTTDDSEYYPSEDEITKNNGTSSDASTKKKTMSWLPIIIIAAAIALLLLVGLVILLVRKKRTTGGKGNYNQAPTNEAARA